MTYMKPYFERVWSLLLEMERRLCSVRGSMNMAFQKNFQGLFDSLIKVVVKILEMFEEGETPKIVQWIKDFLQDIPEIRKLQELIDGLIKDYPDDVEELKRIVAKIISKLEEDTDDVRDAISRNPALQKKINWFFRNYNRILGLQMNKFISSVLNDLLWVSVQYDENHLTVSIPSRRPITSLTQALYYTLPNPTALLRDIAWYFYSVDPIPLRNILWSSPEFFPMKVSHLLPPYNRTAVIVEGKELLTFDGVVLRAPPSPCKVLLVAFKSNSLFMEHPHPSALQQLTLKTSEAMVVINPDYKVFINGQEIENPTVTQSGISVSKGTGRITVSTPFITLQIYTKRNVVSVVISGWAFGETAGLLGSYDGEVANDWLMRSGSRAPNLQELVKSWQEDQHCPTPSISPIIPSRV
ncbi:vitellogenin-like [Palaemon carinicauda]|uniref:vitellogenin-like n=1 Tax=Palaemon carinicauda TaxID=392227 RepID=UPI0035B584AD